MQVIWKNTKELGIGKANTIKNGKPYTYIVARYKPRIDDDVFKNIAKGKFNQLYCRNILAFSRSELAQHKTNSPLQKVQERKFNYFANKSAKFQPPLDSSRKQLSTDPIKDNVKLLSRFHPIQQQSKQTLSDEVQNKNSYNFQQNPALGRVSKNSNYNTNNLANSPPMRGALRITSSSFSPDKKRGSYKSSTQYNNVNYRNRNLNILGAGRLYERGPQDDKLSFFAGNSWGAAIINRSRQPQASSTVKQAEILGKFAEKRRPYKWEYGRDSERYHLNEMVPYRLFPATSSGKTGNNDYYYEEFFSDYDPRKKNYVPKRSQWNLISG